MSKSTDLGLLVLRVGFGAAAATHGAQKLLGWFGGHGIEGTGGFFESVGFTPGKRNATLAGAALTGNMVVASSFHGFDKFYAADGGPELPLAYAAVGTALTLTGPGRYSLDHLTGHVLDKPWMRAIAYAGAVGAAAAVIIGRRNELVARPEPEVVTESAIDEAEAPNDAS
jgi:putative oxidoreductase